MLFRSLERQIRETQADQSESETPDLDSDPEGYIRNVEQTIEQRMANRIINMSAEIAKSQHPDYDEVMRAWAKVVEANPAFYDEAASSAHPAEHAYQLCRKHQALDRIGADPEAALKAAYEKGRTEALAALKAEAEKKAKARESIPESLAGEPNVGDRKSPEYSGPTPIEEILPGVG